MPARSELAEMLRRVPLFEGLSRKELEAVLLSADEVDHASGKEVVSEGAEGAAGFHLILAGEAEVLQRGSRLKQITAGDFFGDIALLDGGPRSATVRALTPLRTLSITSWNFRPLLHEHPDLAYKLLIELCRRLRAAEALATA